MLGLVLGDVRFVLQREADVVEALKQTVAREFVDLELCLETLAVFHRAILEVDPQLISG
jgi:hypothetical protein